MLPYIAAPWILWGITTSFGRIGNHLTDLHPDLSSHPARWDSSPPSQPPGPVGSGGRPGECWENAGKMLGKCWENGNEHVYSTIPQYGLKNIEVVDFLPAIIRTIKNR